MTPPDPRSTIAANGEWLRRAVSALQAGGPAEALDLLERAEASGARSVDITLHKALALRMMGDAARAIETLDDVLAQDPYHFVALLSKGALVENTSDARAAALIYQRALAAAPPPEQVPSSLTKPLQRARECADRELAKLGRHLRQATAGARERLTGEALDRFDEGLDIFIGAKRAYRQEPLLLNYPGLPAIPFYDRALFPWLGTLEAATPMIQAELHKAFEARSDHFAPYIQYPPGAPVHQWGELNHSPRWNAYFLWKNGIRQDEACRRAPGTAALLETLPLMRQPGFAPTVNFSVLEPHTHIPPHTGSANTRFLAHLPLVLPGPARFRVGNVTREWRLGEAWVFDDTIEHEAWNDADQPRTIMIFDLWSPLLSDAERDLVGAMMTAKNAYYAD